jgi:hypothetical protein
MKMSKASFILLLFVTSCSRDTLEKRFFDQPRREWPADFRTKSIANQWRIYLYGVKNREPPPFELAVELAKERSRALDVMIPTIIQSDKNYDLDAVSAVLQMMTEVERYNQCSYAPFKSESVQNALLTKVPDGIKYKCI